MEISFTDTALEHLAYYRKTNNQEILKRIRLLLDAIIINPFKVLENLNSLNIIIVGIGVGELLRSID